jgi:hypothetical protein
MQRLQALVLVGGSASRLKAGGVHVPLAKAFMAVAGRPLLYWNLKFLYEAGVRKLVLAGDKPELLYHASRVLKSHPYLFKQVRYFCDMGNGVHGIPYELRYLLDETFIFDCGHAISRPEHYRALIKSIHNKSVVFSGYEAHPLNQRQPVSLSGQAVKLYGQADMAIAHPIIASQSYARQLLGLGFDIRNIISFYTSRDLLGYVINSLPPEYDVPEEMESTLEAYRQYISTLDTIL